MRVGALVQARMTSRRCPGKVLAPAAGEPMLQYLLERLQHADRLDALAVATSIEASDDAIEALCVSQDVVCHRGPLEDVTRRLLGAAERLDLDGIARVTGDSPLLDPGIVDKAVELFRHDDVDLVTNVHPRTFPRGQSVEVVRKDVLARTARAMSPEELEHVTLHFYRNAPLFGVRNFAHENDLSGIDMAIDTPADLQAFAALAARMTRPQWDYGLEALLELRAEAQVPEAKR